MGVVTPKYFLNGMILQVGGPSFPNKFGNVPPWATGTLPEAFLTSRETPENHLSIKGKGTFKQPSWLSGASS